MGKVQKYSLNQYVTSSSKILNLAYNFECLFSSGELLVRTMIN
jgi:hypothetical protein